MKINEEEKKKIPNLELLLVIISLNVVKVKGNFMSLIFSQLASTRLLN